MVSCLKVFIYLSSKECINHQICGLSFRIFFVTCFLIFFTSSSFRFKKCIIWIFCSKRWTHADTWKTMRKVTLNSLYLINYKPQMQIVALVRMKDFLVFEYFQILTISINEIVMQCMFRYFMNLCTHIFIRYAIKARQRLGWR